MSLRSMLYRLASLLGDANAIKKGKVAQRVVRKKATKSAQGWINKLMRW